MFSARVLENGWKKDMCVCLCVHLFKELQLDGILQELSHGTGTMVHKGFLIKCYWLALKMQESTQPVTILSNTNTINTLCLVASSPGLWPYYDVTAVHINGCEYTHVTLSVPSDPKSLKRNNVSNVYFTLFPASFKSVLYSMYWPSQSAERFCSCQTEPPDSWGRLEPHRPQLWLKPSSNDFLKMKPVGH